MLGKKLDGFLAAGFISGNQSRSDCVLPDIEKKLDAFWQCELKERLQENRGENRQVLSFTGYVSIISMVTPGHFLSFYFVCAL